MLNANTKISTPCISSLGLFRGHQATRLFLLFNLGLGLMVLLRASTNTNISAT